MRPRLFKTPLTLLFFLVLLAAYGCGQESSLSARQGQGNPNQGSSPRPPTQSGSTPGPPVRVEIPAAKVDATIEVKGLDKYGRVDLPDKVNDAVWYNGSAIPGEYGNSVLSAHYNWFGVPRAVFYYLNTLHKGDQIIVTGGDGSKKVFLVDWVKKFRYDEHPPGVFAMDGPPSLALITCDQDGGKNSITTGEAGYYTLRTVVMAFPAPPTDTDAPPVAG